MTNLWEMFGFLDIRSTCFLLHKTWTIQGLGKGLKSSEESILGFQKLPLKFEVQTFEGTYERGENEAISIRMFLPIL